MMGRVSALNSTATYGARPLGALRVRRSARAGAWAPCLVAAAVAFLVQALIIVMSPAARLAHIPERRSSRAMKIGLHRMACAACQGRCEASVKTLENENEFFSARFLCKYTFIQFCIDHTRPLRFA